MSTKVEQSMSVFGVMTAAAMVGAAAALLLAPRKGSETREQIKTKLQQAKSSSMNKVDSVKSKAQQGVDKVKGKSEETPVDIKDAVTEARSQVEDAVAETKPRARRTPPMVPPTTL